MKKFFMMTAFAAVFAMGFTACSNNDDDIAGGVKTTGNTLGFTANVEGNAHVTRGIAGTSANIADFQVWCYDAVEDALYMGTSAAVGRDVTKSGSDWTYSPVQYWPVNNLSFVAVSPKNYTAVSANATSSTSGVVSIASTVAVPTNVENQIDLMYAGANNVSKDDNDGDVPLTFKHALSQIVFKGKLKGDGAVTKATVKQISLVNVKSAGVVNFTSGGTFPAIGSLATPVNYQLDDTDLEATEITSSTAVNLTVSDNTTKKNAWFLLPQQLDGSGTLVKAGGTAPTDGKNYLKVIASMEKDGVEIVGDDETDAIYIPLGTNWERSKKYIYTIEFNGESALTPITFSVQEVDDWTTVDVPALEM